MSETGLALASLTLLLYPILLVLILRGPGWGSVVLTSSSLLCLFFSLREREEQLVFLVPFFVSVFLFCLLARRRIEERGRELEISLERLEWEENLLKASEKKRILQDPLLEEKLRRYLSLSQVAQFLNETLSLNEVSSRCVNRAKSLVGPSEGAFLFLIEEEGTQELALMASEISEESFKIRSKRGDLFDHWVLKNRRPLLVQDTHRDFRFDLTEAKERKTRSLMIAPLFSAKRLLGVFRLESGKENGYEADDLRFFSILADLASVSLENARLYRRTEELARIDELTGLFVHRIFQERVAEELTRAQRGKHPLSLLMIDIDHFKQYNDQYGHIAGDLVLRQVAQMMKGKVEVGEFACRYGGEEFAIILPQRSKTAATALAETICQTVARTDFILRRQTTRVTLSIGVATYPEDGLFKEELLKQVDARLYQAKGLGRSRVCSS